MSVEPPSRSRALSRRSLILAAAGAAGTLLPARADAAPSLARAAVRGVATGPVAPARLAPTPVPDRVVLNPTTSPGTSQAVTWRTDRSTAGRAQVRKSGGVTDVAATHTDLAGARHHRAVIDGLEPGSSYAYRVGTDASWSEWRIFTTPAASTTAPWSFLYFGDAQPGLDTAWAATATAARAAYPASRLSLHAGDLVGDAADDDQWAQWFAGLGDVGNRGLVMPAPGDRDRQGDSGLNRYTGHFVLPENGPDGLLAPKKETVWYVDYGDVRVISLNSTANLPAQQATWLRPLVEGNPGRWTVVVFHHPMFSNRTGSSNTALRNAWLPVLEEAGVDLVLQGHDQSYGRGHVAANEDPDGSHHGPVYVVANAGGAHLPLSPAATNDWTANGAERVTAWAGLTTFQGVTVYADRMVFRSHVAALGATPNPDGHEVGDVVDAFTVFKSAAGVRRVVEGAQVPPGGDPDPDPDPVRRTAVLKVRQVQRNLWTRVVVTGEAATGTVRLVVDGKVVRRATLTNGHAKLRLPRSAMRKTVTVRYGGDEATLPAKAEFLVKRWSFERV